jgi:hypothetical protein
MTEERVLWSIGSAGERRRPLGVDALTTLFPVGGEIKAGVLAGRGLGRLFAGEADDVARGAKARSFEFGDLPGGLMGTTDEAGNITIARGLSRQDFEETLRHETVHSSSRHGAGHLWVLAAWHAVRFTTGQTSRATPRRHWLRVTPREASAEGWRSRCGTNTCGGGASAWKAALSARRHPMEVHDECAAHAASP